MNAFDMLLKTNNSSTTEIVNNKVTSKTKAIASIDIYVKDLYLGKMYISPQFPFIDGKPDMSKKPLNEAFIKSFEDVPDEKKYEVLIKLINNITVTMENIHISGLEKPRGQTNKVDLTTLF
jgi:hypothetical protein